MERREDPHHDPLTNRQRFARDRRREGVSDRQAGKEAGVGRAAMAMRRLRARKRLGQYVAALQGVDKHRKTIKVRPMSLSFLENV